MLRLELEGQEVQRRNSKRDLWTQKRGKVLMEADDWLRPFMKRPGQW